jgi:hypothetical protein
LGFDDGFLVAVVFADDLLRCGLFCTDLVGLGLVAFFISSTPRLSAAGYGAAHDPGASRVRAIRQ